MQPHKPARRHVITLLGVSVLVLAIAVLSPHAVVFSQSLELLYSADVFFAIIAAAAVSITFLLAALNWQLLSRKPLKYRRNVLIAIANMFTNRLLPAGTGSIATLFLYLRRNKHTVTQAGSLIAVNNSIGIAAHTGLLLILFAYDPTGFSAFVRPDISGTSLAIGLSVALLILTVLAFKKSWHRRLSGFIVKLAKNIHYYKDYPLRLFTVALSSMTMTMLNSAALWFCLSAVGISVEPIVALAAFSIGMIVGTLTPSPGGVGGAEAGLLAGLIGYGVDAGGALAAVILYRLLSYWLTILIGAVAYAYVSRRGYLYSVAKSSRSAVKMA